LRAHSQRAALAAQAPRLEGKLTGPAEVIVLHAVPAGDPAKGQLRPPASRSSRARRGAVVPVDCGLALLFATPRGRRRA
jgi:hypothetical protein